MRRFACGVCDAVIAFTASECSVCGSALGFEPSTGGFLQLRAVSDTEYAELNDADGPTWWRCLNFAWGCNWIVPAHGGNVWCESCRLTRSRPDDTSIEAVEAWSATEAAKRRLIAHLHSLGLPLDSPGTADGLVFDLVYLPDAPGVTGHRTGVVTVDLREVDDRFREEARRMFAETDRTVLGHLRHEVGHHYWNLLVERSGALEPFRALFGDERADYAEALDAHYLNLGRTTPDTHISGYATAHPAEDWAESFAHYLLMRDGLETADEFGIGRPSREVESVAEMLQRWRSISHAVNEISLGLGHAAPYPFTVTAQAEAKLAFVHHRLDQVVGGRY